MNEIMVKTPSRNCFVSITPQVEQAVKDSGISEGMCLIYCPHTTAGITVNEGADPAVVSDMETKLNSLIPQQEGYAHAEGNSDSHIKSTLTGCSETIPVSGGRLVLGTWQSIYFAEFDGPRQRRILISITGN